ncbi:MAG: hypothetical protein JNM65_16030 [Verrucomicrobiaceae bacterium]|nr:hypothetical protein [Verrucomicrobiaceae bacterium]
MGFGKSEAGFGKSEAGFGKSEAGFGKSEIGFGKSEAGFGKSEAACRPDVSGAPQPLPREARRRRTIRQGSGASGPHAAPTNAPSRRIVGWVDCQPNRVPVPNGTPETLVIVQEYQVVISIVRCFTGVSGGAGG